MTAVTRFPSRTMQERLARCASADDWPGDVAWQSAGHGPGGYGAVTVKCAVTDAAPEALTVTVA